MVLRAWMLSLAVLCAAPLPAMAQSPDAQAAQEQFRQGRDAFKAGEYQRAFDLFQKSQELYPASGTLLNLALCEAKLGKLAAAERHLNEVVPQLPAGDPRLAVAKKELEELAQRIPRLRIEIAASAAPGAEVTLDGAPVAPASLGTEMRVDPGRRTIEVKAPGRLPRNYDVTLEEGKSASITVEPGPAEVSPPPKEAPPSPMNGKRIAGFVAGGIGLAGLGIGAVTGILALGKKSELEDMCPNPDLCTAEGVELAGSGKTLSIVSTVAFVAGAAGLGAGVYLIVTSSDEGEDDSNASLRGRSIAPAVAAGAVVLPGGGGLTLRGMF